MLRNDNELKKQIAEKNSILSFLRRERKSDNEKIRQVTVELDNLLYTYYKSLKCS